MYCGKCGTKNEDGATICCACGAKLDVEDGEDIRQDLPTVTEPAEANPVEAAVQSARNRKIGIRVTAAVGIAVAVLLAVILLTGRGYQEAAEKFVDAYFDADGRAVCKMIPDTLLDAIMEEEGKSEAECIEEAQEEIEDDIDALDRMVGAGWEVSYEFAYAEDVQGTDLDRIIERYADYDTDVTAAKTVRLSCTFTAGTAWDTGNLDIRVVKIGRSWYVDFLHFSSMF